MAKQRALRFLHVSMSFGLVLLIERFKLDPRWKWVVWGLIAANEVRGAIVAWEIGSRVF